MEPTKERTKATATKGGAQMQRTVSRALIEKKPTLKRSNVSPPELARSTMKPKGQVTFVANTVNKKAKHCKLASAHINAKEPESEEDKMEEDSHVEGDVTPRLNESPPCSPKPVDIAPKTSSTPRKVKDEDKEEMATESDDDAPPSSPKKVPKARTNKFVQEMCKQWMEASPKEGSDISAQKFMDDYFKFTVEINDLFIHMLVSERASLSRILPNDLEEMIPETEDDGPLGLYGNKFIEECCQDWIKDEPETGSELCAKFWMQDYFKIAVDNNDIFVHMLMKARRSMAAVVGESSADKDQQKKPPDSPKFSNKFIEDSCKEWIDAFPDDASEASAKEFLRVSMKIKLFKNEDIFIRMLVEERSSLPVFMGYTKAAEAADAVGALSVEYGPVVKPEGWKVVVEPVKSVPVEMAAAPKSYCYSSRKTGLDSDEDSEDDETLDQKLAREMEVRGGDV